MFDFVCLDAVQTCLGEIAPSFGIPLHDSAIAVSIHVSLCRSAHYPYE